MVYVFSKKSVSRENNPKNTKEAIREISEDLGINEDEGKALISYIFNVSLRNALLRNKEVRIHGFGTLRKSGPPKSYIKKLRKAKKIKDLVEHTF